jgi:hypothetical protein
VKSALVYKDDQFINIETHLINDALTLAHQEIILDFFSTQYCQQHVKIWSRDGENIQHNGVINFVEYLCHKFNIPSNHVVFYSHDKNFSLDFQHNLLPLGLFQNTVSYLQHDYKLADHAKFVGCTIGRFTPSRLTLAHELDKKFSSNLFLIWHPDKKYVTQYYQSLGLENQPQLDWLHKKQFDVDHELDNSYGGPAGGVAWQAACNSYYNIWSQYQIEVVAETHSLSNYWFTEKTSRCLATGKPFVMFSGTGSLKYLQDLGYQTNKEVLDESYDLQETPTKRIQSMIQSLDELCHSVDRDQRIAKLNSIAQHNKEIFLNAYHNQI